MNPRAKKILLLLLAAVLLFGSGQMQKVLNRDREQLGLTRDERVGKRAAGAGVYHGGARRLSRPDRQRPLDPRQRFAERRQIF